MLERNPRTIEPNEEDQAAWIEEIVAGIPLTRAFQETCTPSVYNYEGQVTNSVQHNAFHPAGPLVYIDRLRQWREDGSFKGFERTYEAGRT